MRITARVIDGEKKIALDCKPLLRRPYTIYVTWFDEAWVRPSGREATPKMLDAIDRLSGIRITWKKRT